MGNRVAGKMHDTAGTRANPINPEANVTSSPAALGATALMVPTGRITQNSRRASFNNILDKDLGIWKLQDAIDHWAPAIEAAEFCHRRREGDMAGKTLKVLRANRNGSFPTRFPKEAMLVLNDWNKDHYFWTLHHGDKNGKCYIVNLVGKDSADGAYWVPWLGLKDRYDTQPVAYPIELIGSKTLNETPSAVSSDPSERQVSESIDSESVEIPSSTDRQGLASQLRRTPPTHSDAEKDEPMQLEQHVARQKPRRRLYSRATLMREANGGTDPEAPNTPRKKGKGTEAVHRGKDSQVTKQAHRRPSAKAIIHLPSRQKEPVSRSPPSPDTVRAQRLPHITSPQPPPLKHRTS
ncbi:MAG: hypothetical protein Q9218_008101 [Villophora microphyllina]